MLRNAYNGPAGDAWMRRKYCDKRTEEFANSIRIPAFHAFSRQAVLRLDRLHAAASRRDLIAPPSNRFETLRGDRAGQYSIRINDQWRICFEWPEDSPEPFNIEIVDYH